MNLMNSTELRALPVGMLVSDVDGDVWRIEYAVVNGVEQAVVRLRRPVSDGGWWDLTVRTLDQVSSFAPFRQIGRDST